MRDKLFLLIAFLVMAAPFPAGGTEPSPTQGRQENGTAADREGEALSMELLEFLGEWESDDGEWLDPTEPDLMLLLGRESSDE
jgi:hypothetical protein